MDNEEVKRIALTEDEVEDVLDRWGNHIDKVINHMQGYRGKLSTLSGLWLSSSAHPINEVQDKIDMLNDSLKKTIETYREHGQQILRDEFDNFEAEVSIEEFDYLRSTRAQAERAKEPYKEYHDEQRQLKQKAWRQRRLTQTVKT
tara:strand:- start:977 stop:1411 length:435 start_codon:yes stop_codon:yes gene_type:complete